jgi:hypothetical protein
MTALPPKADMFSVEIDVCLMRFFKDPELVEAKELQSFGSEGLNR